MLSGCDNQQLDTNYYLSLTGKSENWELIGYEVMLTPNGIKVGNGKLVMINEERYDTDFFSFNTYVVTNGEEDRIHGGSVAGQTDISKQKTGSIEGEDGYSFELNDVSEIYMTVEWWDPDKNEDVEEKIILYQKPNNEDSFLN